MVRGLKFRIQKVEGLYYLCSENKGTDELICTFVFAYVKSRFSYDVAQIGDKVWNKNSFKLSDWLNVFIQQLQIDQLQFERDSKWLVSLMNC